MSAQTKTNSSQSNWANRVVTLRQAALILRAEWLIRFQSMARWQTSLGETVTQELNGASAPDDNRVSLTHAAALARRTERAASRLPYTPKCLPKAMALQWAYRAAGIPSRLVVAMHRGVTDANSVVEDRAQTLVLPDEDRYHAWVECGDVMMIGQCERAEYRPIFGFENTVSTEAKASKPSG